MKSLCFINAIHTLNYFFYPRETPYSETTQSTHHTIWQGTQPCLEPASIYQHTDVNGNVTFDWHSASWRCHKASPPRGPMAAHECWSGNELVLTPRVTHCIFVEIFGRKCETFSRSNLWRPLSFVTSLVFNG